jgi:hypothetical protein
MYQIRVGQRLDNLACLTSRHVPVRAFFACLHRVLWLPSATNSKGNHDGIMGDLLLIMFHFLIGYLIKIMDLDNYPYLQKKDSPFDESFCI